MERYFYGVGEFFKFIEENQDYVFLQRIDIDNKTKVEKNIFKEFYYEVSKEQLLIQYDIPLYSKSFGEIYRKRATENNIKFSLSSMKMIFNLYNIKLSIFKIDNNKALVLFEDYEEKPIETNVSIVENIGEFMIFDEKNEDKEYKLSIESWNYNEISNFYGKLSGYRFKTNLFVVDCECQKVVVEVLDLSIKDCEKLLNEFRDEMYLIVYRNNVKILEKNNEQ